MAHVYIRSGASGANNGSSKTDAYTTSVAALAAKAAGDQFWVASDHAETLASAMALVSPGTLASPCTVMCVNFAGSTPPVSADLRTTATITTTGANALTIGGGSTYYYGITFSAGTGAVNAKLLIGDGTFPNMMYFKSCVLRKLGTTGTTSAINPNNALKVTFDNTQVDFGATGDAITISSHTNFKWLSTAVPVVSVFPDVLFYSPQGHDILLSGVDFSAAGFSGKTLWATTDTGSCNLVLAGCKVHASLVLNDTAPNQYEGGNTIVVNSDSSGTNYRQDKRSYSGTQAVETTIFRTGGASDGVTPHSWKITTNANAEWLVPFESLPQTIKNNTTGTTVVVTIFGIWGGGAVPTNRDIWPVLSYCGSSGSPIHTIVSGGAADYLATATSWATDTSTWGGSTTKFKMVMTLSAPAPQLKGPIYVTICAALASSTFYVDPKIVLS